jgi:hypothetical protein
MARGGSLADIEDQSGDVRFTPKSGHRSMRIECPLCAKSGREQSQQSNCLFDHLVGPGK